MDICKQLKHGVIFLILSISLIPLCGFAWQLDVHFETELILGDDNEAPLEYQFASPSFIRTDSQNRIYVADSRNTIRVFSPEGEHIKTIGRRGRGPGEFQDISAMAINEDDEVIVSDARLFRITYFYDLGDSLEVFTHDDWSTRVGRRVVQDNIVPLGSDLYAITAKEVNAEYGGPIDETDNRVVHIMSMDFSIFHESFFDVYQEMFNPENPLERKFGRNWDYKLARLPNNKLALSHEMFNGLIYVIDYSSSEDTFEVLEGSFSNNPMYEILSGSSSRPYINKIYRLTSSSSGLGRFVYQKKMISLGLFSNEEWILNFIGINKKDEGTHFLEVFSTDGEYKGFVKIDNEFTIQDGMRVRFYPMHFDDNNLLYYVDYSTGNPTIKVTKVTIEES